MSKEIETVEAEEIKSLPIEKVIENKLVKANITEQIISDLKERASKVSISGQDDREGYKEAVELRKECKKWRVLAQKICKDGREEAVQIQKKWVAREKEVIAEIEAIEAPLQKMEEEYEAERERIKKEERQRFERQGAVRTAELIKLGATFNGDLFALGEVEHEYSIVKEADDEVYQNMILPKYKAIFDKIESDRLEKERLEKEQREAEEKQRKEFQEQQVKLKEQQEMLAIEQKKAQEQRMKVRYNQLQEIGLTYNPSVDAFFFKDVNVHNKTEINLLSDIEWSALVEKITPIIADRKKEEAVRIEKEQQEKEDRDRRAQLDYQRQALLHAVHGKSELLLGDLSQEEWDNLYEEQAAEYDKKKRDEAEQDRLKKVKAEEEARQAALEQAKDKEKWEDTVAHLHKTPVHEMRSSQYRTKMKAVKDFLATIK